MAKDAKNDPNSYYPRYATDNCADCNDMYYTKWGRVRATNYDLFLPDNTIIAACRNEKGFYPYRDERGLGMSELAEPVDYALAASGALSLGTTAGTDRSISAEFGGSTPHGLSEYYDAASGIPASGAIDFSDFHGASAWANTVTNCLWTHYDFSECSTGTIDKWGTTEHATECQCMRSYTFAKLSNYCVKVYPTSNYCAAAACICQNSGCWNGNSFLAFTCFLCGQNNVNPFAASHHGRANWLAACYGTNPTTVTSDCAANTRIMVYGGDHCMYASQHPWSHTGMGGYDSWVDPSCFYMCDDSNTGRCANLASCHAICPLLAGWTIRQQFTQTTLNCKIWGNNVYGRDLDYYAAFPQWCANSNESCAVLSRASTKGPVVFSMRVDPTSSAQSTYPGYDKYGLGWIQINCTPIINSTPNTVYDQYGRNYWKCVRTDIQCGGYDFWNAPGQTFMSGQYTWATDTARCFQVGEFLVYNCALTDAEYCSVLLYLHNKWQGDM